MKNGIYKPASAYAEDGFACLRMYNIGDGKLVWRDIKRMRLSKDELAEYRLLPGDLLVNRVNSRELVGKAAVIPEGIEPLVFESKNIRLRLAQYKANPKFINYQLLLNGRRHFSTNAQQVVGMASVNQKQLADFPIVLPPLSVQQDTVAEIEKQFSRLDEAVALLKRTKANLKRYKAAVLKAAVEGRLTEGWRKQHPDVEPANKLLERIMAERRTKWNGKGKYQEPSSLDTSTLPKLPHGWTWTKLDQLLKEPLRNGHSAKASGSGQGLRAFTLSAVTEGDFSESNTKLTVAHPGKVAGLWAEPGDIYVERSNTPELVGLARLYKGPSKFAFIPDLLIRVRLIHFVPPTFVEVCLLSEDCRRYFRSRAQGISGSMPKIDQSVIEQTAIPLPPLLEQQEIVAEVERRLSVIDELEATVETNLIRADGLRQSILDRAFRGLLM
jgi:type I restriction enzyme S subunit